MDNLGGDRQGINHSPDISKIKRRIRAANYLTVAQLFLQNDFLLERPLVSSDIKPRLLGHWGTCPGINIAYANLKAYNPNIEFILGPGHGFPALQANLFLDGALAKVDKYCTRTKEGIAYLCKNFSWPGGFPSHANPLTPGVICEGGELGYALATAYGYGLGHPEKTIAVLIGDGELETATALASLNLNKIASGKTNARILPILHLNGYKISAPTIAGRKSERELKELIRGFGYTPLTINDEPEVFQAKLQEAESITHPFFIMKTQKGLTGPAVVHQQKVAGSHRAHQIPLPHAKTDQTELKILERWLETYNFAELFNEEKGFTL